MPEAAINFFLSYFRPHEVAVSYGIPICLAIVASVIVHLSISLQRKEEKLGCFGLCGANSELARVEVGHKDVKNVEDTPNSHLVVLVNGIGGSPNDWKFAEEQFQKRASSSLTVMSSASNTMLKTFDGVDVMGRRLADEVLEEVRKQPQLKKISFVSHSMGGLISRYAIGLLYEPSGGARSTEVQRNANKAGSSTLAEADEDSGAENKSSHQGRANSLANFVKKSTGFGASGEDFVQSDGQEEPPDDSHEEGIADKENIWTVDKGGETRSHRVEESNEKEETPIRGKYSSYTINYSNAKQEILMQEDGSGKGRPSFGRGGTIAGLEPVNFVTIATPHLGCRGRGHLPFLFKWRFLEQVSPTIAPMLVGKSGRHLFLADEAPPLLFRMTMDCPDMPFMSALASFKQRSAYANIGFDQMVGWRTAAIRRATEAPDVPTKEVDPRYRYVMRVDEGPGYALDEMGCIIPASPKGHASEPLLVGEGNLQGHSERESLSRSVSFGSGRERRRRKKNTRKLPPLSEMEDAMVTGLLQVPWRRVDVSFKTSKLAFMAHNLIQVKTAWIHSEGAGVIWHVIDNFEL